MAWHDCRIQLKSFTPVFGRRISRHAFDDRAFPTNDDRQGNDSIVLHGPSNVFADLVENLAEDLNLVRQFADTVAEPFYADGRKTISVSHATTVPEWNT